ncbi:MAG: aldehyde ferredoxin oxidoreductase N-terminal domain-containing protein [Clostridium sp.]|uniref:aldehyde ferredoxin oxidoreductase N-terminal domain-containing protein n=1 Tax=Clostridium sp. TaxID=1506 RepID=UPI0030296D3D
MEKILIADLSTKEVTSLEYDINTYKHYGRGLTRNLLESTVPVEAGRYSKENAIAFVPGLFTGCKVASTCRLMIATKADKNGGMQLSNVTGNFPQKMASLSLAGLVIKGAAEHKNAVVHLSDRGVEIITMPHLENQSTSTIVRKLKEKFGQDAGIIAVGKTADMLMSLSSFICTYPQGEPEYNCPRSGFGDVFGSKGLRAVVVTGNGYFNRPCNEEELFLATGKKLAKLIIDNDICGGALPAYGSVTLIDILKDKEKTLLKLKEDKEHKKAASEVDISKNKTSKRVNFCCGPMCVIGCLNRHSVSDGAVYAAPDESEIHEALKGCYGIDDYEYTKVIREKSYEIGIVGTEFVTASKMYFEATGIGSGKSEILELLNEIEKGTVIGRLVASRTHGILSLYPDNERLYQHLDRKAIEDEGDFQVSLHKFSDELKDISHMDLLYAQIFVLENLGFCIFSSFATVNSQESLELMAQLFTYKTGIEVTTIDLIKYARGCINEELNYAIINGEGNINKNIPPFTKVLYRYFAN